MLISKLDLRLFSREARLKLSVLRKEYPVSLYEVSTEVQKLISIAYGELPPKHKSQDKAIHIL